jgi:hypothetical protein
MEIMVFGDVYKIEKKSQADYEGYPNYIVYIKDKIFVVGHDHSKKCHYKDKSEMLTIKHSKGQKWDFASRFEYLHDYHLIPICKAPKQVRNFVRSEILLYVNV